MIASPAHGGAIEVGSTRRLSPAHLKELAASGISEEYAAKCGFYSEYDRKKLASLVGWKAWPLKLGAALVLPHHNHDGQLVLSRVKPERAPLRNGKAAKYLQPSGRGSVPFLPHGVTKQLADGTTVIVMTEGEKKAACLAQRGVPTIGLSGVWNWQVGDKVGQLLPQLEQIEWHGRTIYIIFDSDAATNQNVAAAMNALAATLQARGAVVKVVDLPCADDGSKQGIDDWVVSQGDNWSSEFQRLTNDAHEPAAIDPGSLKLQASEMDPAEVARRFADQNVADDLPRLRFWRGEWWYWEGGGYRSLAVDDVQAKLVEFLNVDYFKVTRSHVSNVLMHLQSCSLIPSTTDPPSWLDKAGNHPSPLECVATKSGIVHLPTYVSGEDNFLTPSSPRFFTTSSLGYRFEASAPRPVRWLDFLWSLWGDDQQSIDMLQRWFGYCLVDDTRQQKAIMVIGPKRSGKGTIARVLTELKGRDNVAGPTLSSLAANFGLWPLLGKSLAVISDARFSRRADMATVVERFLSVTGEDSVTIDRKNLPLVTCKLPTRFMILTNELPQLGDASGALASRLIILHTPNSFYGQEDLDLTEKLLEELPGILLWAIEGWHKLQVERRFTIPDSSLELTAQMADLSSPIGAFVRDHCLIGNQFEVEVDEMFKAWKAWCEAENHRQGDKAHFGRDLSAAVPSIRKFRPRVDGQRQQVYSGITLG